MRFSYDSSPESMARRKGAEDARAGKSMRVDMHWPKEAREAYRAAYERTKQAQQ